MGFRMPSQKSHPEQVATITVIRKALRQDEQRSPRIWNPTEHSPKRLFDFRKKLPTAHPQRAAHPASRRHKITHPLQVGPQ